MLVIELCEKKDSTFVSDPLDVQQGDEYREIFITLISSIYFCLTLKICLCSADIVSFKCSISCVDFFAQPQEYY